MRHDRLGEREHSRKKKDADHDKSLQQYESVPMMIVALG